MISIANKGEIGGAIIMLDPIDVMYNFIPLKRPPDDVSHNKAMLIARFAHMADLAIATFGNVAAPPPRMIGAVEVTRWGDSVPVCQGTRSAAELLTPTP